MAWPPTTGSVSHTGSWTQRFEELYQECDDRYIDDWDYMDSPGILEECGDLRRVLGNIGSDKAWEEFGRSDYCEQLIDALIELINDECPDGIVFGPSKDDSNNYGYWQVNL